MATAHSLIKTAHSLIKVRTRLYGRVCTYVKGASLGRARRRYRPFVRGPKLGRIRGGPIHEVERGPQIAARPLEYRACPLGIATAQQERGELHAAVCLLQRGADIFRAATTQAPQYLLAAAGKLLIDGLQVDHQTRMDTSEPDHHERRQ